MAMVTSQSTSTLYNQPEYLQTINTVAVESTPSPLTLLMQACNNIGRDQHGLKSVNHLVTDCNISTGVTYRPISVTRDSQPRTSPTAHFWSSQKESSKIESSCDDLRQTGLNGESTSGLFASSVDENSLVSYHRKHRKLELSGYHDSSKEAESNVALYSPMGKRTSMAAGATGAAGAAVRDRRDIGCSQSGTSLSLQSSTESAVVSKYINEACSLRNMQRCSRSYIDDTKIPFQTTPSLYSDNHDAVDLLSYAETVRAVLNSSTTSINSPGLPDILSKYSSSGHIPYFETLFGHLAPRYGSGINAFLSSANIQSGTFLNKSQFPPPSSLIFPSCIDGGSTSSLAVGGFNTLLQQAAALAHYQQLCQQHEETSTLALGRLSQETLATSKSSQSSLFDTYQQPATHSSSAESNCSRYQHLESGASISAISNQNARQCTISGCCCRQSGVDQRHHHSSSTSSSSCGSMIDRSYRRFPFSLLSAPADHVSRLTSSMSVSASSSTSSASCKATDHVTNPYSNNEGSIGDHSQHICSWLNTIEGNFCGRRFSTADSLLHHLRTHCTDQYSMSPVSLASTSLFLSQHTPAATATLTSLLPTGNTISSSASSCTPSSSLYSSDLFNMLHVPGTLDSLRSAAVSSRYHPYQMTSAFDAVRNSSDRQHQMSIRQPTSPTVQSVGLESTMSRAHGNRHHLLNHHSLGGALVAGSTAIRL